MARGLRVAPPCRRSEKAIASSCPRSSAAVSCQHDLWSLCDNTNPNAELQEPLLGGHTAFIYGYTHAFGGYAGRTRRTSAFPKPTSIAYSAGRLTR